MWDRNPAKKKCSIEMEKNPENILLQQNITRWITRKKELQLLWTKSQKQGA